MNSPSKRLQVRNSFLLLFILIFFCAPKSATSQTTSLEDGARQLAELLAAIPNLGGPIKLEFGEDLAEASRLDDNWKTAFRNALEKHQLTTGDEPSAQVLVVAITETPTQLVLTGNARIGDREEVRIVTLSRAGMASGHLPRVPIRFDRQLVFESPDRILDASSLWNGEENGLAVLMLRNSELIATSLDATGAIKQSVLLSPANTKSLRDPRAELVPAGNHYEIRLTGKICEFSWAGAGEVQCRSARFSWREETVLTSPCDSGDWKLEAEGNDWTSKGMLRATPDETSKQRRAVVLSEFQGPLLNINGGQNPSNALIVTRNLQTGNYEVYKIALACGD